FLALGWHLEEIHERGQTVRQVSSWDPASGISCVYDIKDLTDGGQGT
ncbi:hypothetical protein Tco_0373391, partial [Tanacetum coccineum]